MDKLEVLKKFCESCNKTFVPVESDIEFNKTDQFAYWKGLPATLSFSASTEDEMIDELYRKLRNYAVLPTLFDAFSVNSKNQIMGRVNTSKLQRRLYEQDL